MQQNLSKGALVGGRFQIELLANEGDMGQIYKAKDTQSERSVALRIIPIQLLNDEDIENIKNRVRQASSLMHRNIRATFGMGVEEGKYLFIATEWIDGQNLKNLLKKRMDAGKRFSFKGAYNIIGHVCNALTYAHEGTYHGSLSSRAIMVNDAGRVKVHDWALSTVRIAKKDYAGRNKIEISFWAPEVVKSAAAANNRSDIYSLGALFYEMITGEPPKRPLKAPSKLGFSKEVDSVVARCMSADPKQRFKSAAEVKDAVAALAKAEAAPKDVPGAIDDDMGIDIEVDLGDLGATGPAPVATANGVGAGSMLNAPDLPPPPTDGDRTSGSGPDLGGGRASSIDMGAVLANIGQAEAARWMVQKDKFDHGPFSDRELVQMILQGEVLGKHNLLNMDTGVRKKVRVWGDFDEYLERYRLKKKQMEEQAALERTEKAETRGTVFKLVVGLGILGVIGLVVGGYFLTRTLRQEKSLGPDEMVAAFDSGEIKLKMGTGSKKKRRGKGRKGQKGGKGSGQFVDGMSYEEAMNMGVSLGDLRNGGGQTQLTAADIERIMNKNVRRFIPCMSGESTKRVDMNIAVGGNGKVIGVSVVQGSSKLKKCVSSKVRAIKFPQSSAPRTATSWYFEMY